MVKWVVIVDGGAFGLFLSEILAIRWARDNYPIAFAQDNVKVVQFYQIDKSNIW